MSLSVYLLYERVPLRREEQQHWLLLHRCVLQPLLDVPRADVVQRPFGLPQCAQGRERDERMQREREGGRGREGGREGASEREKERENERERERVDGALSDADKRCARETSCTIGPGGELRAPRLLRCVGHEPRFATGLVHLGPWAMGPASRPASPEGAATAPPLLILLLLRLLGIVEAGLRSREWLPRTHAQARTHTPLRARPK